MKSKILIITGDNLGISNEQIGYENLAFLKFPVIINDKEFRESEKYNAKYLISRFKKEKISVHSQALIKGDLRDIIEANKDKYDIIIHIVMGSNMSSATFQIAESIRKEYEHIIPIINIDTKQASAGVGTILLRLVDILNHTDDIDEICNIMDVVKRNTFNYICLSDLDYLYRGGRIGRAKSLMGSIMRIIPVVGIFGDNADLGIIPVGKARTYAGVNRIIIDNIKEKMLNNGVKTIKLITILDFEDNKSSALKDLKNQIENELSYEKLIIGHPRFVEAVYTGPGAWVADFVLK